MEMIGFIQAGGESSRMGEDKAWLRLAGRPMIEHVLAAAQPVAPSLAIVIKAANTQAERYAQLASQWKAQLLYDRYDHCGPLGGIATALAHCGAGQSALILACDLPFVTAELLASLSQEHQSGAYDVTVPLDQSGRLQPLAAIYAYSCRRIVEQMLAKDELRVDRLYQRVKTNQVDFSLLAHLPGAERFFMNINTPEDYCAAAGQWKPG